MMQKKNSDCSDGIFFEIKNFLLKKSYILSKIAPFYYPGTLRVIEPGSGPGLGIGKSQKTGSRPGIPYQVSLGTQVFHYPLQH